MIPRSFVFALALLAAGCGARSPLTEASTGTSGADAGPHAEHIYVAESDVHGNDARLIRFDDMSGTNWTTFRPAATGLCGVAVDDEDRIYTLSAQPPSVLRVDDMEGNGLVTFSEPGIGDGQIAGPSGVALDASGRIYFTDAVAHRVVRIDDLSGAGWVALGGPDPGSGVGQFNTPLGIAVSSAGKILVGDSQNGRVVEIDDISGAGWKELAIPSLGTIEVPFGVSYDAEGHIYVAEFQSSILHRFDSIAGDGHVGFVSSEIVQLSHVFVHPSGRIYMGMLNLAGAVAVMDDIMGTNFTKLGTPGSGEKQFRNPCGIFVR
ncbi:MAG: NHL repeat-containing protein [Minicystis sp.]